MAAFQGLLNDSGAPGILVPVTLGPAHATLHSGDSPNGFELEISH